MTASMRCILAAAVVAGAAEAAFAAAPKAKPRGSKAARSGAAAQAAEPPARTREEVLALIDRVGRTPPDWYDSTPLDYPKTLDLAWPEPAKGPWDNQKNVGQYVWDVIHPNPGRWRQGVRLMHHLLGVNRDRPETLRRVMANLGRMYHELLQDYPRAAFWFRQAGVGSGGRADSTKSGPQLAECYWRLGNREMAVDLLEKLPPTLASIKLWGDLGETDKAVSLAENAARRGGQANTLYLLAGDACRTAGEYERAIGFYETVLDVPAEGTHAKRIKRDWSRAQASIGAIRVTETLDLGEVPDGAYRATSLGYEGEIEVEVRVAAGRIEQVRVTRHKEKQFYSSLEDTPRKIVARQGVKGVDATTAATITSEAIINATASALAEAMGK